MEEKLKTVDAETLQATPMNKTMFIIEDLIPQGLTVLSGASKIGKSWLMLWLCLQVAEGKPVWNLPTYQCDVLYLSLEDTLIRIKDRLYKLSDEAPDNLYFAVACNHIGDGLEKQITDFIKEKPDTKLIIIDTLQKVRNTDNSSSNKGMYANDYNDITSLKKIADENHLAIILVHHLRKLQDVNDPFNEVSGSTGLVGAADTNLVLKRKRSSTEADLFISGRDVEYQEITLEFNDLHWEFVERKNEDEIHKTEIPEFLFRLVEFVKVHNPWTGTATELLEEMNESEVTSNMVTKYCGQYAEEVFRPENIIFKTRRTGKKRYIYLMYDDSNDGNDGDSHIENQPS